jgi:hypothetical protein
MPKRRGRPALEPHERRVNRGIRLPRETWDQLKAIADIQGRPEARVLEELIADAARRLIASPSDER